MKKITLYCYYLHSFKIVVKRRVLISFLVFVHYINLNSFHSLQFCKMSQRFIFAFANI